MVRIGRSEVTSEPRGSGTPVRVRDLPSWNDLGSIGLGVLGGLALAGAFPPWNIAPLAVIGPALLVLALRGRRAFLRGAIGLAFGAGFFGALLSWAGLFGLHAWSLLTMGEAAFAGVLGVAAGPVLAARRPLVAVAGWAGLWILVMEVARARFPLGGFPWGPLGAPFVDTPVDGLAPLGGALAMSGVAAFAGALLALVVSGRLRAALAGSVAMVVLVVGSSALRSPAPAGAPLEVAVVQGNVPLPRAPASPERTAEVLADHAALTGTLSPGVFDLVIWPEDVLDLASPRPEPGEEAPEPVAGLARRLGTWFLVGTTSPAGPARFLNSALVVDSSGRVAGAYDKVRPVPFGEYVPGRRILRFVTALRAVPRDMVPGPGPRVLPVHGELVGTPISYEVAFAGIVRGFAERGAQLIVVPTNTSSYGPDTPVAEQELQLTRLRAVELGLWVIQAAPSGISAIVDPAGRIVKRTDLYEAAILTGEVRLGGSMTLFVRWGEGPAMLAAVAAVLMAISPSVRVRMRRPSNPRRRPSNPGEG
jgi:apolipoprotein N-acyltransferase